jgi:hypothetical protein
MDVYRDWFKATSAEATRVADQETLPHSAGCIPSATATAVNSTGSLSPSDAARKIRSAIFAFVAGVRLATLMRLTASSRTDRNVKINSGSNSDGETFAGDNFLIIKTPTNKEFSKQTLSQSYDTIYTLF